MCVVTLACIRVRSPCEDVATRIEDKKAGARKTTLELEEELMKKYAEGARKRKDRKDATKATSKAKAKREKGRNKAKKARVKEDASENSVDNDADEDDDSDDVDADGDDDEDVRPMKSMKATAKGKGKGKAKSTAKAKAAVKTQKGAAKAKKEQNAALVATAAKVIPHYNTRKEVKLPKVGDGPFDYKQGRIYTSGAKGSFRVICKRGDYYTERQAGWKDKAKPDRQALEKALQKVEEYRG